MKKILPVIFPFLLLSFFIFPSSAQAQVCGVSEAVGWERRTSWPDDCDNKNCNRTQYLTPYCAQSFEVQATIEVDKNDCQYECDGKWWTEKPWNASVSIDVSDTKVPFAGKKKEGIDSDIHEDEIKYLADYFEGTHEYYRDYTNKLGPLIYHGVDKTFLTNFQGVLRKLAPYEYQNQLKKQTVERAIASNEGQIEYGQIHDYKLHYLGRLCWDAPFWLEFVAEIVRRIADRLHIDFDPHKIAHYCIFDINPTDKTLITIVRLTLRWWHLTPIGHILKIPHLDEPEVEGLLSELKNHEPPSPDEEDYVEKWNAWKESNDRKWFKLWQVAPMVSREDTLGYIHPDPQLRPHPGEEWIGPDTASIRVPHLARLFETSRWIQQILLPLDPNLERTSDQELLAKANLTNSSKVLGSSNENSCGTNGQTLGEKTVLAQDGNSLSIDFYISLKKKGGQGDTGYPYDLCWLIRPHATGDCNYAEWGYRIDPYGFHEPRLDGEKYWWNRNPIITCSIGSAHPIEINAYPGDTVCATLVITGGQCEGPCCDPDPRPGLTRTACCQIFACGASSCDGPSDIPFCLQPSVPESPKCVEPAITDTNPNDKICPKIINGTINAVQEIENPYCEECANETCLTNPNCCGTFSVDVYRQMEVKTELPYLTEIWHHSTDPLQGFFNILRPAEIAQFDDTPAKSEIKYKCESCSGSGCKNCRAIPEIGDFYYFYLGGVQLAKEWVIDTLTPYVE
ncbi:MAG: hypothetical protein C0410_16140 [Anaerolinea sp.]|nr:hypothetical protein [Anaerolinea sp.]